MKVTLDTGSAVLDAAKQLAEQRKQSLDSIVSELMFKALRDCALLPRRNGFPVFPAASAKLILMEDVKRAERAA
jgi:hypothetical protein